jgi:hypothetical protein
MTIVLTACSDAGDAAGESPTTTANSESGTGDTQGSDDQVDVPNEEDAVEQAQDLADDLAESLEGQQEASGGGGATLTVGDTTWTFDRVLCAFGPEEIGQEGAEFVLSSLQDGLQLYVSIDSFGHSVSLDDVSDFQNPSVSLSAEKFTAAANGSPEEFVEVNGNEVTSTALFLDGTTDDLEPNEGTLEATCP